MNATTIRVLGALFLAGCLVMSGWVARGWKAGSDLSKAIEAQQAEFNANLEVKNANLEVVAAAYADLSGVRVRLQTCKTAIGSSASEIARAGVLSEKREADLRAVEQRIKSDALSCDLFVEDLRAR